MSQLHVPSYCCLNTKLSPAPGPLHRLLSVACTCWAPCILFVLLSSGSAGSHSLRNFSPTLLTGPLLFITHTSSLLMDPTHLATGTKLLYTPCPENSSFAFALWSISSSTPRCHWCVCWPRGYSRDSEERVPLTLGNSRHSVTKPHQKHLQWPPVLVRVLWVMELQHPNLVSSEIEQVHPLKSMGQGMSIHQTFQEVFRKV